MPKGIYPRHTKSLEERFWEKVCCYPGECWEWLGCKNEKGYGYLWTGTGNVKRRAHRISYELLMGAIPSGKLVLHKCDNRGCVNPQHLWLGTASDNSKDMVAKNRHRKHGLSLKVKENIRKIYGSPKWGTKYRLQKKIAHMFGITSRTVREIVKESSN